jgi:hypothetical protein
MKRLEKKVRAGLGGEGIRAPAVPVRRLVRHRRLDARAVRRHDQRQAFAIHRVLRPAGSSSWSTRSRPEAGEEAGRLNGLNKFLVGCECNRDARREQGEGFRVAASKQSALNKVPKFVAPASTGAAATA